MASIPGWLAKSVATRCDRFELAVTERPCHAWREGRGGLYSVRGECSHAVVEPEWDGMDGMDGKKIRGENTGIARGECVWHPTL